MHRSLILVYAFVIEIKLVHIVVLTSVIHKKKNPDMKNENK